MPAVVPSTARPPACPEISPDAPLVPLPPFEAYAADVDRLDGRAPLGPVDDAWLALAHALARAAALPRTERSEVCAAGARMVAASIPERADDRARAAALAAGDAVGLFARKLAAGSESEEEPDTVRGAVDALLAGVAHQEQAGAFLLAFSTLAAARRAFASVLDPQSRGMILAQQGRVARQLGALATAARLYRAAERAGRRAESPDVVARALLGAGVLANMRGNYPRARVLFRRALRAATAAGCPALRGYSHHGLLLAAFAANDVDAALAHGWAAFSGFTENASEGRAEMLLNLGEVGCQTGEHRAALGACLSAIELTDLPRLRLPALGTAARAAAALGEHHLLEFLARDVERTVARSGQQFENARTLVELAEAFDGYRDDIALRYAARAQALASAGTFFEVAERAARVFDGSLVYIASGHPTPVGAGAPRSPRARAILRSLETMPAVQRYEALAAC